MTARPPSDAHDPLSPEERELAARLSELAAPGPSAALDARILAAARTAAAPAALSPSLRTAPLARRTRRWPTALGAMATLVVAVGLAWQLKPVFDLPPPLPRQLRSGPAEGEVLATVEAAPAVPEPPAALQKPVATPEAIAAPMGTRGVERRATARAQSDSAAPAPVAASPAPPAPDYDFVDEAIGDASDASVASSPAAAPPATAAQRRASDDRARNLHPVDPRPQSASVSAEMDAITVTGSRIADIPTTHDAALPPEEWLTRIRLRRDRGDIEGARESLRRFVREYPRLRLPDDLRALRSPAR